MGMLVSYRRRMGLLVVGILAALLLGNLVPDPSGRGEWRGGARTGSEPWFRRAHAGLQSVGFYFQDNFGFRASLPLVRHAIREALGSPDSRIVYFGRHGQMFWAGQSAPEQSSGFLMREEAVDRFVALVVAMQRRLAGEGTKVVVALPPNAQSVDLEDLPAWQADHSAATTEYSRMLQGLKREGITTVDLRSALRDSPEQRRYLATDTHWTSLSSVVAFNATMRAAGHPDWQVPLAQVVGPKEPMPVGDLARMLRRPPPLPDENNTLKLKEAGTLITPHPALRLEHESRLFNGYSIRYEQSGPRVLILGDSYTVTVWPKLFAFTPVAEAAWAHFSKGVYGSCDFDFADVERFRPDILIVARTERMFPCLDDAWPDNLPPPAGG